MKPAILIPVLTVVLAAGALHFFPPGKDSVESRPTKIGRDSSHGPASPRGMSAKPGSGMTISSLAAWATEDAKGAEEWASGLEGKERDEALGVLVVELASSDAAKAVGLAERISDPKQHAEALGFALAQLAGSDPEAVFARLEKSGEDETVRSVVERAALPALAEADPVRVARWISEGKATPQVMEGAVAATVQRWTQKDARAAAEWVAAFDDQRLLRGAMEPLMSLWTKQDLREPAGWIEGLPPGAARDEACAAYASALVLSAPDEAEAWAGKIQGEELVAETRRRIQTGR